MKKSHPKVTLVTCMKNEGPFIMEWVAWHRSIGVTDFIIFTNDCSDGTTQLLDGLDDRGYVQHLPNPAGVARTTKFQPIAISYAHGLKAFRQADYIISTDVDEFLEIKLGNGHLTDLFSEAGEFDVISVSEINHGANQIAEFEDNWVTEQFVRHGNLAPGKWRSRRGVKSISRNSNRVGRVRNHRPDTRRLKDIRWLDGSLRPTDHFTNDLSQNGHDCRGSYGAVALHHYPLRSLHSYLVKIDRGDVVSEDRNYGERYWRMRNQHESTTDLAVPIAQAKEELARMYQDDVLRDLHQNCVKAHQEKISQLQATEAYQDKVELLKRQSW